MERDSAEKQSNFRIFFGELSSLAAVQGAVMQPEDLICRVAIGARLFLFASDFILANVCKSSVWAKVFAARG